MPLQDRTNEFHACVESIRTRSSLPAKNSAKQRLLDKQARVDSKGEFTRMASTIGKDISSTTIKLGKLAQCGHPYPLRRCHSPTLIHHSGKTENVV
jgi:syntaxin 5